MISYLKGEIILKRDKYIIVNLGAIGYQVYLTSQTLERLQDSEEVALFTHTHVREDALELYGFITWEELEFFGQLLEISGVGPRTALAVLSEAPIEEIKKAVVHGDPAILQRVTGIGKKTAERIIVELKEKIRITTDFDLSSLANVGDQQVVEALVSLGYKERELRPILSQLPAETTDLSQRIKEALRILGGRK